MRSKYMTAPVVSLPRTFRNKRTIVHPNHSFSLLVDPLCINGISEKFIYIYTMPAAKRSRKSGARASTTRGKRLKANLDSALTNGKHFVSDDDNVEQTTRVNKRTKISQTSANPERWTPYFKSKRLHTLDSGAAIQLAPAGDEQAGDSKGLENSAMQVRL